MRSEESTPLLLVSPSRYSTNITPFRPVSPRPVKRYFYGIQVRDPAVYLFLDLSPVRPARHPGKSSHERPARRLVHREGGSSAAIIGGGGGIGGHKRSRG